MFPRTEGFSLPPSEPIQLLLLYYLVCLCHGMGPMRCDYRIIAFAGFGIQIFVEDLLLLRCCSARARCFWQGGNTTCHMYV